MCQGAGSLIDTNSESMTLPIQRPAKKDHSMKRLAFVLEVRSHKPICFGMPSNGRLLDAFEGLRCPYGPWIVTLLLLGTAGIDSGLALTSASACHISHAGLPSHHMGWEEEPKLLFKLLNKRQASGPKLAQVQVMSVRSCPDHSSTGS
eukprot:5881536-Amphidinium_carterae.1